MASRVGVSGREMDKKWTQNERKRDQGTPLASLMGVDVDEDVAKGRRDENRRKRGEGSPPESVDALRNIHVFKASASLFLERFLVNFRTILVHLGSHGGILGAFQMSQERKWTRNKPNVRKLNEN